MQIKSFLLLILTIFRVKYMRCDSECNSFKTCSGCISYAYEKCVWCISDGIVEQRCQSNDYINSNKLWCNGTVYDPSNSNKELLNEPYSSVKESKVVQFKPQHIAISARPGLNVNFTMNYKPAEHYPLDVYYLMDYSYTMTIHKKKLELQAREIKMQLSHLTNNVRLGVGSFIEKPGYPYALYTDIAYAYKNHLSLTSDMKAFEKVVKTSTTGSNLDNPEATLDALMQVMVCEDELGWRKDARRVIVLCTDSTYHSAGDGKMVGASKPNDMKCHLDATNHTYTLALSLDYPSVSQINKIATEKNFKVIFAGLQRVKREYEILAKKVKGAVYVELNQNSNIVDMIIKEYKELLRYIQLDAQVPSHMELKLNPDCSKNEECVVKHNEDVKITGTLKVKHCPKNNGNDRIVINPVTLNEKLIIDVTSKCQCDCEKEGEPNSKMCNMGGTYQCSVCKCNKNRYGDTCRCIGTSVDRIGLDNCKANKNDTSYCSGRGTCICGKCETCHEGFSGDFCQFNDNDCAHPDGKLCAGRGQCKYGRCECDPHWIGDDCNCPDHDRGCIAPYSENGHTIRHHQKKSTKKQRQNPNVINLYKRDNSRTMSANGQHVSISSGEICSGNGECTCGSCVCNKLNANNKTCSGRFCDDCEEYTKQRCKELKEYVNCIYFKNCDQKYNQTSEIEIIMVNKTDINSPQWQLGKWCKKQLEDGSSIVFRYVYRRYSNNNLLLIIQNELELPSKAEIWIAVGSVVGAILLIGLLTVIIWKILVDVHDGKEYKRFTEEAAAAGFDVSINPLYQEPAVKFTNPTYDR